MNTPDTEWEKEIRNAGDFHTEAPVVHASNVRALLTSRDTYWKERVEDINKSFVGFMEAFVENGDNAIDLESLEEWRQHTLLDNLK